MKRNVLTAKELEVLENTLIEFGAVVTFNQLANQFNEKREYTRKRINKLTNQGWLKRIKKGVFVLSDLSSRGTLSIHSNAIINHLVEDAYLSFESALQHHGIYNQLMATIKSVSLRQFKDVKIDNIRYQFVKTQKIYFYGWQSIYLDGQSVKIATLEKALIDLIQFSRTRYSTDLVLEKFINEKDNIDLENLFSLLKKANLTTQRIIGFLLDFAKIETTELFFSMKTSTSVSHISRGGNNLYNHKWKLYYDQHFNQYAN